MEIFPSYSYYSRYGGLYFVALGVTSGDRNLWTNVGFNQFREGRLERAERDSATPFVNNDCSNIGHIEPTSTQSALSPEQDICNPWAHSAPVQVRFPTCLRSVL
jgi:hypothetical protein